MAIVDFLLQLANAFLYYCAVIAGLIVAITVGVNTIHFQGVCILYGDFTWTSATSFVVMERDAANCNFPIYFSVFGLIFYGLLMGAYNTYAMVKSRKDPTIGGQMWVMPFLLVNTALAVTSLIVACILSVGFSQFCSGFTDKGYKCKDGTNVRWKNPGSAEYYDPGNYIAYLTVAQVAAWAALLIWLIHIGLGILRFVRNRRYRSALQSQSTTSDKAEFVNDELEPTA